MSRDDQINCRFEPVAGSMNPHFWGLPGALPNHLTDLADTEEAFQAKHGKDLRKSHPEVYKRGVLKKAQGEYRRGEFTKAMNILMTAFKIRSLRQHFEPDFFKKQAARDAKKKRDEE